MRKRRSSRRRNESGDHGNGGDDDNKKVKKTTSSATKAPVVGKNDPSVTSPPLSSETVWSLLGACVGSFLGLGTTFLIHQHAPTKTWLYEQLWKPLRMQYYSHYFQNMIHHPCASSAQLFQSCLILLLLTVLILKVLQRLLQQPQPQPQSCSSSASPTQTIPRARQLHWLQGSYLMVFWLYRATFWMSGPYFYAAYASKPAIAHFQNSKADETILLSYLSLAGYSAIALLGPTTERWIHRLVGRKWSVVMGALGYALGNLSVAYEHHRLWVLFVGRGLGGIGQSLVGTCAEAWFVAQVRHQQEQGMLLDQTRHGESTDHSLERRRTSSTMSTLTTSRQFLGDTFGWGFSWDSAIAVVAGQLAGWAAHRGGPTAPFAQSPFFLALAIVVIIVTWSDHSNSLAEKRKSTSGAARPRQRQSSQKLQPTIRETLKFIWRQPRIMAVGIAQASFESAMYIWVLSWSPVMKRAIQSTFGEQDSIDYGTAFSSFMAACMLGSTILQILPFAHLERVGVVLYVCASASLFFSCTIQEFVHGSTLSILQLFFCYLVFEAAVGMYFPLMCTIRSSALPDTHRSVIMSLFAVPLNAIIVSVCLSLTYFGHVGAMKVASALLGIGASSMLFLDHFARQERAAALRHRFQTTVEKVMILNTLKAGIKRRQSYSFEIDDEIQDDEIYEEMRRRRSSTWNY